MSDLHRTQAWRDLSKRRIIAARDMDEPCGICGRPIDYELPGNHRMGATTDHPAQLQLGGEALPPMGALRVAHRRCNSSEGAKVRNAKSRKPRRGGGSTLSAAVPHPAAPAGNLSPTSADPLQLNTVVPLTSEDVLLLADCTGGTPRFFTPSHPRAVRSLFDAECERFIVEDMGYELRPWQRAVLLRALEVDADGQLCWRVITVSVGRQSGKTYLIRMLTNLRVKLFAHLEPQQILHIGRVRDAARSVIVNETFARWAKAQGIVVRSSNGQEQWRWPDDSTWDLSSLEGAYGRSSGLVLCDETWDITRRQFFEGVQPVTAARDQAQIWFFSAAHREATELTPLMIQRARQGRDGYALFDWGAGPDDDLHDPETWRRMGPHWDRNRALAISDAAGEASFREQWANVWPNVLVKVEDEKAMVGWAELRRAPEIQPPRGGIFAIDQSLDASVVGVLRLVGDFVYYTEVGTMKEAAALANIGDRVIVGVSLVDAAVKDGLKHPPIKYGSFHTAASTATLTHTVKSGRLWHDHHPGMLEQAAGAVVVQTEAGKKLSAKKSGDAGILACKLLAWALHLERSVQTQRAAIY